LPPKVPIDIIHTISQIMCAAINRVIILQYINIVLSLKQRYKYMNYLLSEPLTETEFLNAKHSNGKGSICRSCKPILLHATLKLNFSNLIYVINSIHELLLICSHLHYTLGLVNRRYGIPIFLYTISTIKYSVPIFYLEIVNLQNAIRNYGDFKRYLDGSLLLGLCTPHLLFFCGWLLAVMQVKKRVKFLLIFTSYLYIRTQATEFAVKFTESVLC